MADYYNKTRSPLAVSLQRGTSISIAPKQWITIAPEDEGTESLAKAVSKGFLVVSKIPAVKPAPVVLAVEEVVPVAAPEVKVEKPVEVVEAVSLASTTEMPVSRRKGR